MRLVTFRDPTGATRCGALIESDVGTAVVDLQNASDGRLPATLEALLATPNGLEIAQRVLEDGHRGRALEEVRLLAPVQRPGKIVAVAGNYPQHLVEGGMGALDHDRTVPRLFLKPSTTVVGPDESLLLPDLSDQVDWEVELAVVIGRRTRQVPARVALDSVAGYCVMNDVSARRFDWGIHDRLSTDWDVFFDWLVGKWPDGFAPIGPWLVTPDELPDPQALALTMRINGEVRQAANTSDMIFSVAEIIEHVSRIMTLEPGDILTTGTPAGVGVATNSFLKPGDLMEASIEGIGTLRTPIAPTLRTSRVA
jgi:2-keto-4-pentenoate hydratase/2-oxohepta-3-ene-1,7-dioic acid hydratase in catechol pathway